MPVQGAARKGDQVTHTQAMNGMLIGVGIGVLAVVTVLTLGADLPILAAAAVVGGAGLFGEGLGATEPPSPCGPILEGVPSILIGPDKKQAAMATAHVHCNQHSAGTLDQTVLDVLSPAYGLYSALTSGSGPQIAEGSSTVFVSSQRLMAARMGDKGTCGFVIGEGLPTVIIGGPTGTAAGLSVDGEVPKVINYALTAMMLAPLAAEVVGAVAAGVTASSVGVGVLALGRLGLGVTGGIVGAEVLGDVGEHYFGPKGKVVGQFLGGFLGGYGASKGAGKVLPDKFSGPIDGAASRGWSALKGVFGGEAGPGAGVEVGPGAGAGTGGTGGAGASPGEPAPTFQPHTPESLARGQAAADAFRDGIRRGDDLPGRGPWGPAQSLMDAMMGRARLAPARAGAGGGARGGRPTFDEGGGVFSPKKGGNVLEARATGTGGGGTGGGGSGSGGPGGKVVTYALDSAGKVVRTEGPVTSPRPAGPRPNRPDATYIVDGSGKTTYAEGRITGTHPNRAKATYRPNPPGGLVPGEHRGHLVPEQAVDHPPMVNIKENLISEAPSSNLSAKKIFENRAVSEADNSPSSTIYTTHEPVHNPGEMRPYEVKHSIEKDGTIIHTVTIPNQ